MKNILVFLCTLLITINAAGQLVQSITFKNYFENKTMCVDYFHSGTAKEE